MVQVPQSHELRHQNSWADYFGRSKDMETGLGSLGSTMGITQEHEEKKIYSRRTNCHTRRHQETPGAFCTPRLVHMKEKSHVKPTPITTDRGLRF